MLLLLMSKRIIDTVALERETDELSNKERVSPRQACPGRRRSHKIKFYEIIYVFR